MPPRLSKSKDFGIKLNGTFQIIYSVTGMQQFLNDGHGPKDANTGVRVQDLSHHLYPFALDSNGVG